MCGPPDVAATVRHARARGNDPSVPVGPAGRPGPGSAAAPGSGPDRARSALGRRSERRATGRAVRRRLERDAQERAGDDRRVRPALVGQDRDRRSARRAASARASGTRAAGRSARTRRGRRGRPAGRRGRTGSSGASRRSRGRRRTSPGATPATGRTPPPPYSARAQSTRSVGVEAIAPAPPAAVMTEVNGATRVPSERSIGLRRCRARTGSRGRPDRSAPGRAGRRCGTGPVARRSDPAAARRAAPRRPVPRGWPRIR